MDLTKEQLDSYDFIIVAFSGGKDSIACVLKLLEDLDSDKSKIELWHHDVDGREGSSLMDWPVTRDYCRKFAEALEIPIYFSWRKGGLEGEMMRWDTPTGAVVFEGPGGTLSPSSRPMQTTVGGDSAKLGRRHHFPLPITDLSRRWCSAVAKIDVGAMAIRNSPRFDNKRTLVVTGERAQESAARAKYKTFEKDRAHSVGPRTNRHVDHYRPVHGWDEKQVWHALKFYNINPHPAYRLGWSRVSCATCIFGEEREWAMLRIVSPKLFEGIVEKEEEFGLSVKLNKERVTGWADRGDEEGLTHKVDPELVALVNSEHFTEPIILAPGEWKIPYGAYKGGKGSL